MKAAEKKCRVLWQQIVTLRDGCCVRCGYYLVTGHHVFGRTHNGSSFEPDSGLSLCVDCHEWSRKCPQEAHNLLRAKIGEERYIYLEALSRETIRLRGKDFQDIAAALKLQLLEMKGEI